MNFESELQRGLPFLRGWLRRVQTTRFSSSQVSSSNSRRNSSVSLSSYTAILARFAPSLSVGSDARVFATECDTFCALQMPIWCPDDSTVGPHVGAGDTAFVHNARHLDNDFDSVGSEGLEGMKVICSKPPLRCARSDDAYQNNSRTTWLAQKIWTLFTV